MGRRKYSTKKNKEKTKPTCVELFAGAGGLLLGLEQSGFHTIVANEIHEHPCMTLKRNFPQLLIICKSLRNLSSADILKFAGFGKKRLQVDLVAGGPPCQGFSTAGLKDPDDPRNTLLGDFLRIVKELQPHFFLLENVPGLKSLHKGRLFSNLLAEIDKLGYNFNYKILFAADYGVPQMRKRLFILGSQDGLVPNHPEPTHKPFSEPNLFGDERPLYVTCGDALGDIPTIRPGEIVTEYESEPTTDYQRKMRKGSKRLFNHQASWHRPETMAYYGLVPPGGTALDIPPHLRKRKQGIQRWPLTGLSRAITTEPTDFLHPTLNRVPTVRETARIQSFPDWYEFMGQRTTGNKMRRLGYCSQTQQVGNAVPPLLARAIGKEIIKAFR